MALRSVNQQQIVLQAEVLWNKVAPMRSDDPLSFLLHTTVPVLLESAERRPTGRLGRDETAQLGPCRNHLPRKLKSSTSHLERIQWQPENRLEKVQGSPDAEARRDKLDG